MSETKALVGIVCGSKSDLPQVQEVERVLERLGVPCESRVLSAHRQPVETAEYARSAKDRGLKVLIAMAGLAAHLPGVLASHTSLPVLGVPLSGGVMGGLDALLSIVSMPGGGRSAASPSTRRGPVTPRCWPRRSWRCRIL